MTKIHIPNSGEREKEEQILKDIQVYLRENSKSKVNITNVDRTVTYLELPVDLSQNDVTGLIQGLTKRGAEPKFIDGKVWLYIKRPRVMALWIQGLILIGLGLFMAIVFLTHKEEIQLIGEVLKEYNL